MGEVAFPGQVHRDTGLVGGLDDLGVANRPTWLYHRAHACVGQHLETVGEGEERIGSSNGREHALRRRPGYWRALLPAWLHPRG